MFKKYDLVMVKKENKKTYEGEVWVNEVLKIVDVITTEDRDSAFDMSCKRQVLYSLERLNGKEVGHSLYYSELEEFKGDLAEGKKYILDIDDEYKELKEYNENDYCGNNRYNPAYHTNNIKSALKNALDDVRKQGLRVYLSEKGDIVVANTCSKEASKVYLTELFAYGNDERNL